MSENAQKPRIRFKGFCDAWEQRKLSEFVDKAVDNRGKTPPIDDNGTHPLIEVAALGGAHPDYSKVEKYLNDDSFKNNLRAYVKEGDILFTTVGSIGLVSLMDSMEEAAIAQNIVAFRAKENFVPEYLYSLFSNEENQYKAKRIVMGAVQPSIKVSQLVDVEYMLTQNVKEQQKIGEYFSNLNNLITLHQRKYDKLVAVKKSLLEKMFPADGETVPKIRFKGFSDAWEQRKLWKLTIWDKKFNGVESYKQVKVIKYPYVLADVFSQIEDMSGTVRLLSTGSYIGYTTKEKAGNNLCYGEIVAIPWGGVANIKYYNGFFVTADNRIATSSNTQVLSNRYLHWWMESNITQIQSTYRGASIQHPSMNDILSLSIYLPSIEEQEKISNKLDTLDNLITLHQRQLEKLKNIKSALLEKMFV